MYNAFYSPMLFHLLNRNKERKKNRCEFLNNKKIKN